MSVIDYSWDFTKEEFSLDLDFFNEKEQEDKLWQARTGLNPDTLCATIETIIFMQDRPINIQKIKSLIDQDLPLRVVHDALSRLQSEYEASHHGIRLMEIAQGYQFRSKATYSKTVQKVLKVETLQLSPTAIEVLAIIAYRQPISKTDVENIRGVDSSHIIRALMDRRLVKITGRSEEMGRPSLYGTTAEFLETFNLRDIDQLPTEVELEEIASANEIGEIADIKTIVKTGDKAMFDFDEIEELDQLSASIRDIVADTSFTQSLKDMDKMRKSDDGVEKKSAFDLIEEFVDRAQVIEQNKKAFESESISLAMEAKPVTLTELQNGLINAPTDDLFEEMDTPEMQEMREQAEAMLEKSEKLLESLLDNPEEIVAAHQEFSEEIISEVEKTEEQMLSDELDKAFENLMGESESESLEETEDLVEQDLSDSDNIIPDFPIDIVFEEETSEHQERIED